MRRRIGLALALLVGLGPGAWAQISTGNIYGSIVDESGAILPGASITLAGPNIGARTTTSDSTGGFRFLNLDAGTYKLTAALAGFATVNREVRVTIGQNVNLAFNMKVATVEETVTVSAETPVIDVKKTGTGTTLDRDELSQIPNSRDPWAVLRQVPGVLVDRVNQAGTQSGQQSGFIGKGSSQQSAMWVLDGVVVSDPAAVGASPSYYDFDAFDQVSVTTGGADPRVATGGVGINLVTKRGTNNFHGGVRGFFTHDDLQSSNLPDELVGDPRLQGSDKADHADQITDYGADLGGPLIKDKLWFWGSYGKQDIRIRRFNQNRDRTVLKDYNAKLNWQVTPNDMFSLYWFNGVKDKYGRAVSIPGTTSEEASHTRNQTSLYDNGLHGFFKGELNHVFSPSFVGNVKYSYYDQGFSLTPQGGRDGDEQADRVNSIARGSSNFFGSIRPAHTVNADLNYFVGHHELKFGFGYRKYTVTSTNSPSGGQVRAVIDPVRGRYAIIQRESVAGFHGNFANFYVGDTYSKGRLTVNLGARYDHQTAQNSPTNAQGNKLYPDILPSLSYDGSPDTKLSFDDVSPRAGITYALDDQRKTILRGSFGIFTDQLAGPDVTAINPVGVVGQRFFPWNDLNGDGFVQQGEVDLSRPDILPPINITPTSVNTIDPDYKARRDMEAIAGIDHELAANFVVSLSYTFRRSSHVPYAPYIGVNGTDWVACDASTGNGFTASCLDPGATNAAALDANGFGINLTNRPDYTRHYNGVEATALKRLSNKWMARVAFSYNNWTEHFNGRAGIQDPNPNLYDTYGNFVAPTEIVTDAKVDGGQIGVFSLGSGTAYWVGGKWQLSAAALYQLPAGFEIAGNLYSRQGYIRPLNLTSNNLLGSQVLAVPVGDNRLPNIWNLDMRLAKNLNVGSSFKVGLTVDAFNILNAGTTLRQVDTPDADSFNRIDEILNPRLVRFGLRLTF
jgi:Carboxypeptidase regulatory-like domain/TonB-dependent Receptor Plug Domain